MSKNTRKLRLRGLVAATTLALAAQAGYAASSKSGFGMSFGATGEYIPEPYLRVGGQLGFDSFGDYNETSFRLYMKYLIGGSND